MLFASDQYICKARRVWLTYQDCELLAILLYTRYTPVDFYIVGTPESGGRAATFCLLSLSQTVLLWSSLNFVYLHAHLAYQLYRRVTNSIKPQQPVCISSQAVLVLCCKDQAVKTNALCCNVLQSRNWLHYNCKAIQVLKQKRN